MTPVGQIVNTTKPDVTGDPLVGSLLTADPGTWTPNDPTLAFEWLANGSVIDGATSSTYSPVTADLGKQIAVRATASKTGYLPATETSAQAGPIAQPVITNITRPAISGKPATGEVMTADPGTWSRPAVTLGYQWLAGGSAIAGATQPTFTPGDSQVGKALTVRVTASKTDHLIGTATSEATAAVTKTVIRNSVAPKVTGTAKVGRVLSADEGTWSPANVSYRYQWFSGTRAITGATSRTYTVPASQLGERLKVRITASRAGASSVSKTTALTTTVIRGTFTFATLPSITGTAQVGKTLSVAPAALTPSTATVTYQWLRAGTAITNATKSTYTPVSADIGKAITLKVTYTKTGYTKTSKTTLATGKVTSGVFTFTTPPSITGTAQVGKTLSVAPAALTPSTATLTYQWLRAGTAITNATKSTYTPVSADIGKAITLK